MLSKKVLVIIGIVMVGAIGLFIILSKNGVNKELNKNSITVKAEEINLEELIAEKNLSTIYLAGGCFWGVEEYMDRIAGVYASDSGYANGNTENPSYQDVISKGTGHAETVRVVYDKEQIPLNELLQKYFSIIDPTSLNQQGNDKGTQYRTGIYYVDESDKPVIDEALSELQKNYDEDLVVENEPLNNFYLAEEYHQDYLKKNQNGYCHINLNAVNEDNLVDENDYPVLNDEEIKNKLSEIEYSVTQEEGTERAFTSPLNNNYEVGVYVDVVTGEPLFLSTDKYDSGTGWPSFTRPIVDNVLIEDTKNASLFRGTEVKSRSGNSHLGHVFTDGPQEAGGLRYCINGAALKFIPYTEMTKEGYGYLKFLIENDSSITVEE